MLRWLPLLLCCVLLLAYASGAGAALAGLPVAQEIQLRIEPTFGSEKLELETKAYPTTQNGPVTITTCRFYLSSLCLTYTDGTTYTESASYHLVDVEDESSLLITLTQAPNKPLKTLAFCVGVDSAANVAGAQGGDLEPGRGMYWAWHSGYINAKLEGRSPVSRSPRHEFEFHIGGFQMPYSSLRRVVLPVLPGTTALRVQADIGRWLEPLKLAETAAVVVPGPAALAMADGYAAMFRLVPLLPVRP